MKNLVCLLLFIVLHTSCTKVNDPYSLVPKSSSSAWSYKNSNTPITSKSCDLCLDSLNGKKLSLAELIDIGLQNNPQTKRSWENARAAAATYSLSLAPYYPIVNFSASYSRVRQNFYNTQTFTPFYLTVIDPLLSVNYTIFDFGKRKSSSESAKQALYYTSLSHNQNLQNVLQTIIDDYYDYVYQKNLLDDLKYNLENTEALLDSVKQRHQLGLAALGELSQARMNYLQTKINLTTQRKNLENSYAKLATDLGLEATIHFEVIDLPEKTNVNICLDNVDDLINKAKVFRQDFLAAQADVQAKEASIREAKANRLPTITGNFNFGRNYYSHDQHDDYNFTAQVSLNVPIFQGFFFKNGIRVAEANFEETKASLRQTELTIFKDVSTAHFEVSASKENLLDSENYFFSAHEQFDIALSRYKVGTANILDVLSAQGSLADARSKLANAKKDWYSSLVNLAFATGSLCSPVAEDSMEELTEIYKK